VVSAGPVKTFAKAGLKLVDRPEGSAAEPPEADDWAQEKPAEGLELSELLAHASKKDKKHLRALEQAAGDYGTDFVRKLDGVRDPRERIVFVAEAIFARMGFGGARTQAIADLAGVNKAMIHYYFDSKEKLYHAVLDKILFDLIKLSQEASRDDLSIPRALEVFYRGFFDYVATHRNFSRITSMDLGSQDRYLARLVETFFKPLFDRGVAFIKAGIAQGDFRKVDARQFLLSVYGMTMSYFSEAEFMRLLLGEDPFRERFLHERREQLLDLVFAGLGCKRP